MSYRTGENLWAWDLMRGLGREDGGLERGYWGLGALGLGLRGIGDWGLLGLEPFGIGVDVCSLVRSFARSLVRSFVRMDIRKFSPVF